MAESDQSFWNQDHSAGPQGVVLLRDGQLGRAGHIRGCLVRQDAKVRSCEALHGLQPGKAEGNLRKSKP